MHGVLDITVDGSKIIPSGDYAHVSSHDINTLLSLGGGFNMKLSDETDLNRIPSDFRDPSCRDEHYDYDALDPVSVIIIFHNEGLSMLLRSVHSVLNLTPPSLLKEVILVDDASTAAHLSAENGFLDRYVQQLPKTKLIRSAVRRGIVGARLAGIEAASAPIFVILDSHIEVQQQWLEPLTSRISQHKDSIVMPAIDGLNNATLQYSKGGIGCTLGFIWKMMEHAYSPHDFKETTLESRLSSNPTDYISSPTMAGGLFAANKNFFLNELGGYDRKFSGWGAENLELSFRTWMCGGRIECSRCSRVFHMFRSGGSAYSSPQHSLSRNKLRLIHGWMDEFQDLALKTSGLGRRADYGDISEIEELRKRKRCKSFSWYLNNVWPESFVRDANDVPYLGKLQNLGTQLYLEVRDAYSPAAQHYSLGTRGDEFMYFKRPKFVMPVVNDEACLSSSDLENGSWCHFLRENQFDVQPFSVGVRLQTADGKCLTANKTTVTLAECINAPHDGNLNDLERAQVWSWPGYEIAKA
uniref:Polypeptide N-acetylgalactosaminyltransferase n=1 Tax=Dermatophagoides pteronyssinus TaxID=6956 RepID=A0A6P6Y7N3_DERPT|nr:probable N-acetylgalactosaminyltransferase 9 [Dermatophagoides pteronyssinus]